MSNKVSLISLAKKFLGIEIETEEAAAVALEVAEAPPAIGLNADEGMEAITSTVEALGVAVAALLTDTGALHDEIAALKAVVPEAPDMAGAISVAVEQLRAEVATKLNAFQAVKSGQDVAGDGAVKLPGETKTEKPTIDLLASLKGMDIAVMKNLS